MPETTSQTVLSERDVTREVIEFFALKGLDRERYAIHIPNLFVVARDGLLNVTRHVRTFDGCHPYEYDATRRAERFAVRELRTRAYEQSSARGAVDLGHVGDLPFGSDEFDRYRFVVEGAESGTCSEQELSLEQYLANTAGLSNVLAEQLVRYDQTLHVSAAEPFHNPITIPKTTAYGRVAALHDVQVVAVSVATTVMGKVAALSVQKSGYSSVVGLDPVPLSDIRFSIHDVKRTPEWLANTIPWQLRKGDAGEAMRLLDEWNHKTPEGGLPYYIDLDPRDSSRAVHVVTGRFEDGMVHDLMLTRLVRPSFRENGWLSRIVIDEKTQQAFAIDRDSGMAISMHQLEVRGPKGH